MIIAVNFPIYATESRWSLNFFQASNFQLHKLENSLRWSLLTFIYIRSSYMNYFIYFTSFHSSHGKNGNLQLTLLPMCGFIAQLVEHRTGNAEVTGSNPVEAWIFFFRLLISSCINWKIHCDDHFSLSSTSAVPIWIISYTLHRFTPLTGKMGTYNWPCSQCVAS